jgi:putative transposase
MIVEIMAFCLMPNHFHLILKQKEEDGIADFMQKLGAGYTGYFNQKYERSGVLFQGKYKFIRLINEPHFVHLPNYIHLNPLSIENPDWKDKGFKNYKEAISFLEKYRWSSFLDYIGKKNFPSVTQRDLLLNFFKGPENYKEETFKWLEQTSSDEINDLITF